MASKTFPGFSSIYLFTEAGVSKQFRADIGLPPGQEFAVPRGEARPKEPVPAKWMQGRETPTDVVWTGYACPVIVSNRVVAILEETKFTGWDTYRVELSGKSGEPLSGYRGLIVRGRCGIVDNSQSRKVDRVFPGGIFPVWMGLYFDPTTWDGSDLFMPTGNAGWIFATESVRRAFEKQKVKNVVFTPLDQVERMKLLP